MTKDRLLAPEKVRLIQVAKRKLNMEDAAYRRVLLTADGVESSRNLSEDGFRLVMDIFAQLGFQSTSSAENMGRRPGFATAGQIATIRRLWSEYTAGEGDDRSLGHWIEKRWKVSALRFVQAEQAPKIIAGLRAMTARGKQGQTHAA